MMDDEKNRAWTCKNGHVLGYLRRVRVTSQSGMRHHETRLDVLRHAIDTDAHEPAEVDVLLTLTPYGGAMRIRCDVCDATRSWEMHADLQEQLDRLIARVAAQRVVV